MPLIPLELLEAHPDNANVMPEPLLAKLVNHIRETGNYPPLIVRPLDRDPEAHPLPGAGPWCRYQILDGHHRAVALGRLSLVEANCDIWHVDDEQAAILLLTLNRLHGEDDPRKRGRLLSKLRDTMNMDAIAAQLPDDLGRIERLIAIAKPPPDESIASPRTLDEMPHAVTFFLSGAQRKALFARLAAVDRDRSAALVNILALNES